ncbi:lysophospholipid acyltransferase family protein [Melittangium boletus]|uniref:lysophospholipid acyltransferase family protein n=1 Tax=Melittangium boletus TaxID=83453 RepID=UPI003DA2CC96
MKVLATLWFWVVFLTTAPICTTVGGLLWLVTWPFDRNHAALHAFVSRWCHVLYLSWPGWKVRIEGREHLPEGPAILVANHQSASDILVAMGLGHPYKFVAKASLFRTPMVGWLMTWMGYVAVRRGTAQAMERMLADCTGWLRRGVPVLIYPEGTYSSTPVPLPFKRGAFQLAIAEQVPVVPVVIEGTTRILGWDGLWLGPSARVRMRVLPPVPVASFGEDPVALADRVRGLYLEALGLPPEAQAPVRERKSA